MPVFHSVIHKIDKKPNGLPVVLFLGSAEQVESQARDDLVQQFNESYNATAGKGWGFFHADSGAHPLSGWLAKYLAGGDDFLSFTRTAVEHLTRLMEESNLTTGGHALFCHYQQGLTNYLIIALVQETEAVTMTEELHLMTVKRLDLDHIRLAPTAKSRSGHQPFTCSAGTAASCWRSPTSGSSGCRTSARNRQLPRE